MKSKAAPRERPGGAYEQAAAAARAGQIETVSGVSRHFFRDAAIGRRWREGSVILWSIRQVLHVRSVFLAQDSPRRLALGSAFGMVLGLLPKGNLLAVGISTVILATRVNLGTAMMAAAVFSLAGVFLDPFTHQLGWWLLNWETLEPAWTFLYGLPLAPWTSFNNTVVLGSLVAGFVMAYPTYLTSYTVFDRWQEAGRGGPGRRRTGRLGGPARSSQCLWLRRASRLRTWRRRSRRLRRRTSGQCVSMSAKPMRPSWESRRPWTGGADRSASALLPGSRNCGLLGRRGAGEPSSGLASHTSTGEPAMRSPRST